MLQTRLDYLTERVALQSFTELPLSPGLQKAIVAMGYETPSPIQAQAIPKLLGTSTDFLGLAATGTGKTAAFGIPLLEQLDPLKKFTQALILCPTRELALQVSGQINLLGQYKGIRALPVYGGSGYRDQIAGMKQGAPVIVGTPGRLVDHIERGTLRLSQLSTVILDEADEMISMGFKVDLDKILSQVPPQSCKTWLFSATMSPEVRKVADKFLKQPQQVQVNRTEMLSSTVEQIYYVTREGNKPEVLCKLIDAAEDFYGLIFCQTKTMVQTLTQLLVSKGYKADCLHGDRDQGARERTMRAFRERQLSMLVCTDVASRGLDVKDTTHVINFSLPRELEVYVHRIGRTARGGQAGVAMSLVTQAQHQLISRLERLTKKKIKMGVIPSRKEIGQKKVHRILASFKDQPNFARAEELLNDEWRETLAQMAPSEVAARFLAMDMKDLLADREQQPRSNTGKEIRTGPAMRDEEFAASPPPRRGRDQRSSRPGSRPGAGGGGGGRGGSRPGWSRPRKVSKNPFKKDWRSSQDY